MCVCKFIPPKFTLFLPLQFVPINFVDRCSLRAGDEVALVDCLGHTVSAILESVAALHYLGGGWEYFLKMVGAVKGDSVLFEFSSVHTCKIVLFAGVFGVQKFPLLEDEFHQRVLYPRQPHKRVALKSSVSLFSVSRIFVSY